MSKRAHQIKLALKGMAMGIAEVIPGVSGGTIALITGIYETLISTIKSFDLALIRKLFNFKIADSWKHVNGPFIVTLGSGMLIGVVVGVFGVTHLMEQYPEELWGFFFGLIMASALYVAQRIPQWSGKMVMTAIGGAALAFIITLLTPAQGNAQLGYIFLSGAIAICALILPGISGSFVLLLLGMYTVVIPTVKHFLTTLDFQDFTLLAVFGLGCITGLATFSRVLSWMFKRFHDMTLALLTGFMIGSLSKIWPWRNVEKWMDADGNVLTERPTGAEEVRVLTEQNVLPGDYLEADPNTFVVVLCAVLGFAIVFVLDRMFSDSSSGSALNFD